MGSRSQNPTTTEAGDSASDIKNLYSSLSGKERERRTHVTTFEDDTSVDALQLDGNLPDTTIGTDDITHLDGFVKRPLKIFDFQWAQNDGTVRSINPMSYLFNNSDFRAKLDHWRNFRGNLKLKIVMNGNPFYYGRMMVAWEPHNTQATIIPTLAARDEAMQLSQRMHLLADPSSSEPLEMTIPYFLPEESLNMVNNGQINSYGLLYFFPLNDLRHCNGSTNSITVSTFAWLESYEVAMPTNTAIQVPAGVDERHSKIYKIATKSTSAVARARNMAKTIEPYASAIEKSSMALAKTAMLFGFSKPEKDTGEEFIPYITDDFSTTDGSDAVKRLVADTKQGLTTDPRTIGLSGKDELDLVSLVTKESFFATMNWSSTSPANERLGSFLIDPMMNSYNPANNNSHQFTPMGLAALTHKFWTGSMILRLQIVGTGFQRGRLLVQYDPEFTTSLPSATNVVFSHVVDISDSKEIEFEIGWSQNTAFRYCGAPNQNYFLPFDGATQRMSNVRFGNGFLSFYVLNELVGPATVTDVDLNIFVRGGDDMIFVAPTGEYVPRLSLTVPPPAYQSPAALIEETTRVHVGGKGIPSHLVHEYCGEQTVSFRSLMKRYNYNSTIPLASSGSNQDRIAFNLAVPRYPKGMRIYSGGTVPSNVLDLTLDGANDIYTENVATTLITFLGWCFACTRGAVRWAIHARLGIGNSNNARDTYPTVVLRLGRTEDGSLAKSITRFSTTSIDPDTALEQKDTLGTDQLFMRGAIPMAYTVNPMVKIETPFYSWHRFSQENRATTYQDVFNEVNDNGSGQLSITGQYVLDVDSTNTSMTVDLYCATAEDFQLLWFQCVPKLYFVL